VSARRVRSSSVSDGTAAKPKVTMTDRRRASANGRRERLHLRSPDTAEPRQGAYMRLSQASDLARA
jgi:hypothetical protein